jgi:methionyl-tRNA synthetase
MPKPLYLTTTLPYVNAAPHVGFALELVLADILARYHSLLGREVFFNTGTDEHGLKLYRKAQEEGKEPQVYVDEYAAKFRELKDKLGLHPELHFVRTTDPAHKQAAQEMWRRCLAAGDIEKRKYQGLYCVGDEAFVKEADLVDGKCPNHPTMELLEIEEENYFFKLSNYQARLLKYLEQPGVIVPEWRRLEAINFVERGLEDFSISRVKDKMPWGVPVPDDETQAMYVWFDALTNYISTLGWPADAEGNFAKFWVGGETLQLAGKDQVRFQSVIWQAMLMSARLPTTQRVLYHGFVTSGGQKMSKSIGNVIDPLAVVAEYGVDALRYYLARHIHPFEDSDFTLEKFKEAYNANLANGLGNLVARVMKMATMNNVLPDSNLTKTETDVFVKSYREGLESFNFNRSMDAIWGIISWADQSIQSKKPFEKIKTNRSEAVEDIQWLIFDLGLISDLLVPFMPDTAMKIREAIKENKMPDSLFPRKE